jgi:hypothetical protein
MLYLRARARIEILCRFSQRNGCPDMARRASAVDLSGSLPINPYAPDLKPADRRRQVGEHLRAIQKDGQHDFSGDPNVQHVSDSDAALVAAKALLMAGRRILLRDLDSGEMPIRYERDDARRRVTVTLEGRFGRSPSIRRAAVCSTAHAVHGGPGTLCRDAAEEAR